jgi:hypothetical protein
MMNGKVAALCVGQTNNLHRIVSSAIHTYLDAAHRPCMMLLIVMSLVQPKIDMTECARPKHLAPTLRSHSPFRVFRVW